MPTQTWSFTEATVLIMNSYTPSELWLHSWSETVTDLQHSSCIWIKPTVREKSHSKAAAEPVTKHHHCATPKCSNSEQLDWQNRIFPPHLIIDGINLNITCVKTQGTGKTKQDHRKKNPKNHHTPCNFVCKILTLAEFSSLEREFWTFLLKEARKLQVHPLELLLNASSAFAVVPTKAEPSPCPLGDIWLGHT